MAARGSTLPKTHAKETFCLSEKDVSGYPAFSLVCLEEITLNISCTRDACICAGQRLR